jgi:anti-sigma factor RsiW
MHCRRVRSFLSAYYRNELSEKHSRAIAVHLEKCSECRREGAAVRELFEASRCLPEYKVSEDFNSRLLNRIAEERFAETRTKAFLPKRIPIINFQRVTAVVAAACFVFAFIFAGGLEKIVPDNNDIIIAEQPAELDNSYQTIQPESEHWAFNEQLERATRIKDLMNRISGQPQFSSFASRQSSGNRLLLPGSGRFIWPPQNSGRVFFYNYNIPETLTNEGVILID